MLAVSPTNMRQQPAFNGELTVVNLPEKLKPYKQPLIDYYNNTPGYKNLEYNTTVYEGIKPGEGVVIKAQTYMRSKATEKLRAIESTIKIGEVNTLSDLMTLLNNNMRTVMMNKTIINQIPPKI